MEYRIWTNCPSCQKRVLFGYRRVGPSQVKCRHCGQVMLTGYKDWDGLDNVEKRNIVLKELFFPSWTGCTGLPGFLLNLLIFALASNIGAPVMLVLGLIIIIPIALILGFILQFSHIDILGTWFGNLMTLVGFLIAIPIILIAGLWPNILFLYRSIKASRKLKLTNHPPVW